MENGKANGWKRWFTPQFLVILVALVFNIGVFVMKSRSVEARVIDAESCIDAIEEEQNSLDVDLATKFTSIQESLNSIRDDVAEIKAEIKERN